MTNRIKNYRRIGNWENFFMDSAIYSVAESLGVKYDHGFTPIAAITGDLFAYMYADTMPCDSGLTNYVIMPETVIEALESVGCGCQYLSREQINHDIPGTVERIRASVDRGIPVLAWGVGGVPGMGEDEPMGEGALIGGYDDDMLLIHLYCGAERLPAQSYNGHPGVDEDGYTAIPAEKALALTDGIFICRDRITPTDPRLVCQNVLMNIPKWLTLTPTGGRVSQTEQYRFGQPAFNWWAEVLLDDAVWQTCDACGEELIWNKHCSAFCALCTSIGSFGGDSRAVDYLRRAEKICPEQALISQLLPLFENLSALWQRIWNLQDGFMPLVDKMREHDYRACIAAVLLQMGECCGAILQTYNNHNIEEHHHEI